MKKWSTESSGTRESLVSAMIANNCALYKQNSIVQFVFSCKNIV